MAPCLLSDRIVARFDAARLSPGNHEPDVGQRSPPGDRHERTKVFGRAGLLAARAAGLLAARAIACSGVRETRSSQPNFAREAPNLRRCSDSANRTISSSFQSRGKKYLTR